MTDVLHLLEHPVKKLSDRRHVDARPTQMSQKFAARMALGT